LPGTVIKSFTAADAFKVYSNLYSFFSESCAAWIKIFDSWWVKTWRM